jgi:hypothetical protein
MNGGLLNPMSVFRLFKRSDSAKPQTFAGAKQLRARLGERIRDQRALHQLHRLDDRDLDALDLARADSAARNVGGL